MKKIKIFLLSLASSLGAIAADIDVTPGQLESILGDPSTDRTELKLRGAIDARDLAAIENLPSDVESLDLSGVRINSLTMPTRKYFGRTLFQAGEIPAYTFFKTSVAALVLPADITTIGEGAFAGSEVTELTIPEGVTSIGDYAFYGCPNLKTINLPSTLKTIGKGTFGNCMALESLDLSATAVREIPERAFAGSMSLADVKLPSGIEKVGREAFSHTAVSTLDLGRVGEFDAYALSSMPFLEKLTINPDAKINDGLLMDNTSLTSLTGMPEYVPDYFAANCGQLATEAVKDASGLGKYAFANTLAPETLYLPGWLTSIDRGALSGLNTITKIDVTELGNNVPSVDETTFEGLSQPDIVLWVDDEAFDAWESHPVWRLFKVMSQNQTGVDEITVDGASAITIACRGGLVVVESAAEITDVRVYTADGRMAYVASPGSPTVEIEAATLPSGVVVVAATDAEGNSKTASMLLK